MNTLSIRTAIFSATIAALLITGLQAETPNAQTPRFETSLAKVPHNAFGYVHVDLVGMSQTNGLTLPLEILSGVQKELDQVFESNIGVRPSELLDVTFVISSFESAMTVQEDPTKAGVGLIAFKKPVSTQRIADSLDETWKQLTIDNRPAFLNSESRIAIYHLADNVVALGTADEVQWLIENRHNKNTSHLTKSINQSGNGQIKIGINGEYIPPAMTQFLPSELKSLGNLNSATILIDLADGVALSSVVEFKSDSDAENVVKLANAKIDEGKKNLRELEASTSSIFENKDLKIGSAMGPLGMLAGYRFVNKIVDGAEVAQYSNEVRAKIGVKGFDGGMAVICSLTAIQAIGTSANAEFEAIASELDAAQAGEVEYSEFEQVESALNRASE